jgi:hypothetical protein
MQSGAGIPGRRGIRCRKPATSSDRSSLDSAHIDEGFRRIVSRTALPIARRGVLRPPGCAHRAGGLWRHRPLSGGSDCGEPVRGSTAIGIDRRSIEVIRVIGSIGVDRRPLRVIPQDRIIRRPIGIIRPIGVKRWPAGIIRAFGVKRWPSGIIRALGVRRWPAGIIRALGVKRWPAGIIRALGVKRWPPGIIRPIAVKWWPDGISGPIGVKWWPDGIRSIGITPGRQTRISTWEGAWPHGLRCGLPVPCCRIATVLGRALVSAVDAHLAIVCRLFGVKRSHFARSGAPPGSPGQTRQQAVIELRLCSKKAAERRLDVSRRTFVGPCRQLFRGGILASI